MRVSEVRALTETSEAQKYIHALFDEMIGKPLSYKDVTRLVKVMQRRSDVERISVDGETAGGDVKITVVARLKFHIKDMVFNGNSGIPSSRLRTSLGFEEGSLVDEKGIKDGVSRMIDTYRDSGFFETRISYDKVYLEENSGTLRFDINEPLPCTVSEVLIAGSTGDKTPDEIKRMLNIKSGAVLKKTILEKRLLKFSKRLLREDYRLAKIGEPSIFYDRGSNTARIVLNVDMGPKIKIVFKGNRYFYERDSRLEKVIRLGEERQFSTGWVEAGKFELVRFYRSYGYALVNVEARDEFDGKGTRIIRFFIDHGKQILIKKIFFKGNQEFNARSLEKMIRGYPLRSLRRGIYVKEDFAKALGEIEMNYQGTGYLAANVGREPLLEYDKYKKRVMITVTVQEGKRFFAGNTRVLGNTFINSVKVEDSLAIREGEPYDPFKVKEGIEKLKNAYLEDGFKFVSVYTQENMREDRVDLTVMITEGDRVRIGKIGISGNKTTDENVIRREMLLKEGDYYSPSKISRSEEDVGKLGLFSSVGFEERGYNAKDSLLDLNLKVVEKKKRSLRTRLGYGSDEGLRGSADMTFINIGGKARSVGFELELSHRLHSDNILRRRETVSYREPRLFGSKFAGKIAVMDEREEEPQFNIDRTAVSVGIDSALTKHLRQSLTWNLEYRKPFDLLIDPDELSPFDETRKRLGYIDLSVDYDRRNDIFNPTRGYLTRANFDIYNKGLWSELNFLQVYSSNSFYLPIWDRIRMLVAVKFGFSRTYGSTREQSGSVPVEKRFRLGGSYSLRGFPLDSVGGLPSDAPAVGGGGTDDYEPAPGGNSVFNYNLEVIFPFIFNFDFVLFTDGGEAYPTNRDFNPLNIRNSAGFGLRYNTPIGPLRIDVGFILDRRTGEDWGAVQFAVGLL